MENSFESYGLKPEILQAINDLGYVQPSEIQQKAIPFLVNNEQDFIGLAQTGTGKTAAFGFPLLQKIHIEDKFTQALIICPTRELCLQIADDLSTYAKYIKGLNVVAVYGGANISGQIRELKRGAHIIVATPGRMLDHIERGTVQLKGVKIVVLDEADEMLNMGFQEDIDAILQQTPDQKTTWLFSATMPTEVRRIANKYMEKPFEVTVSKRTETAANITHRYYVCRPNEKYDALKRLLDYYPDIYAIVFARTKIETQDIAEKLIRDGYNADALHGDLSQNLRDKTMSRFRERGLQILVATDVAARGLDIDDITHVINYDLPDEIEVYIHRSGRTARAGKSGFCLSIVTPSVERKIAQLRKLIGRDVNKFPIPQATEVVERRFMHFFEGLKNSEYDESLISDYLPRIMKDLESYSREDLIKRFCYLEFLQVLEYYKNAKDIGFGEGNNRKEEDDSQNTRFFINLGEKDGFDKIGLIKFIESQTGIPKRTIQRIEVLNVCTFFNIPNEFAESIIPSFEEVEYQGRAIKVEVAPPRERRNQNQKRREGYEKKQGGNFENRRDKKSNFSDYSSKRNDNKSWGEKKNYSDSGSKKSYSSDSSKKNYSSDSSKKNFDGVKGIKKKENKFFTSKDLPKTGEKKHKVNFSDEWILDE